MEMDLIRDGYGFRYFFNAGLDKRTGQCDQEGSDVFEKDKNGGWHYIGTINNSLPEDIEEMSDCEFHYCLEENFII